MTAAKRIVTAGVAVLAVLAGSGRRPSDSHSSSTLLSAPFATLEAQSSAPVAELVADINPAGDSDFPNMRVFQGALYFSADDGASGTELWRLGTTGGPIMVADIVAGPDSSSPDKLTVVGDTLYFTAFTPEAGLELWQYDGITASLAADVNPGAASGDILYLTAYGNQLVFRGNDGVHGSELFTFDDTGLGLLNIAVENASCPAPDCESRPYGLTVHAGILYFGAFDLTTGFEVFSFDGSNFQRLTDLPGGPTGITGLGNRLVFGAFDSGQYRVYSYDIATTAVAKLSDAVVSDTLFTEGAQPIPFNNVVYFRANDGINGEELWSSDGTPAGTQLAKDVNAGPASSLPRWLTVFNGELYFSAAEPTAGGEPRAFDGVNLRLVKDLNPGPVGSEFRIPAVLGSYLIFEAVGENGVRPWYTTGSAATTDIVRTATGGLIDIDDPGFTFFNGGLYLRANDGTGDKLWRIALSATSPTATTVVSSLNPSTVGDQVTFTATVTGTTPTGDVTFLDGGAPIGTSSLAGGSATFTTTALGAGSHTITAEYNGDADDAPSSSSDLIQVVNKIPTTTTLTSSLNPSVFTEPVTFTATVSPVSGSGTPTGDVTFSDGLNALATVALVGNTATLQMSTLGGGAHTITASYAGSVIHEPSTSNAVQQTVTRLPSTTTLFSSPEPSTVGETVTFSAAVAGWFPTGQVTFSEGGVTLGTAPIIASAAGNIATLQISTLTTGVHPITATYGGDTNHLGSSAGDNHTVNDPFPPTPPVANAQGVLVSEDTPTLITLTGSGVNNDPLTFIVLSQPTNGALMVTGPNVLYTPSLNYNGLDSFSFKVNDGTTDSPVAIITITVTPVNDAPIAVNDTYTTLEDAPLVVALPGVLLNDSDVENNPLTALLVSGPAAGALTLENTGAFTYTPPANFSGSVSFTYGAYDGALDSNVATVSIAVTPMNDPPVANSDNYSTNEGTTLTVAAPGVLTNDTDVEGSPLTASLVSGPTNGTLTLNANGSFSYTPNGVFAGTDSFTYQASDGAPSNMATVTITVVPRVFTWTATGNLGARRRSHTATLLPNGKVLVAGGNSQGNGALSSAEIYDPVTGLWTATGSMQGKRAFHTATLLPNGHVLVAGGESNVLLNSSETYDPATGLWTRAGSLTGYHSRHTATLLQNGSVLAVGGYAGQEAIAELYDPQARTWSVTASLRVGTNFHTATLLPNGTVLVAAGYSPVTGATNRAELYDPASGTWSDLPSLNASRSTHTATPLPNGKVLVAGGGDNTILALATAELFDPATGTWTPTGSLSVSRGWTRAALLPSGRVLVAGGFDAGQAPLTSAEVYDPTTGLWSPTASLIAGRWSYALTLLADGRVLATGGIGALASAEVYGPVAGPSVGRWDPTASGAFRRRGHTATLLPDGRVLVTGGLLQGAVIGSTEIFDPTTGLWTPTGSLNQPRAFHVAVLLANGKVLVAAGSVSIGYALSTEIYDPTTGAWTVTGSIGVGRAFATATLLPANRGVLLAGGITGNGPSNTSDIYNLTSGSWSSAGSFTGPRYSHRATALPDGRVLLTGGVSTGGNPFLTSAVIYDPATFTWADAPNMASRRASHTATLMSNGKVLVAGGTTKAGPIGGVEVFDPASGTWTAVAGMKTARALHSATLLPNGNVLVAGGQAQSAGGELPTSELFDPTAGTWTATGNLAAPRTGHTATLLIDGKVLVIGGWTTNDVTLATAELYTP